jgi:hypothetical protein
MSRSTLAVVAATFALALGACADDGDTGGQAGGDGGTDGAAEDVLETDLPVSGDTRATVQEAQVNPDGTVDLTLETDEGTVEATASTAARVNVATEAGGRRDIRLSSWLEDNEFDPSAPYTIVHHDREVVELRETTPAR